jgi:hypothetical protein
MKQSPMLEFESSAFAIVPGEDEQTNPGVYGNSLAHWIAGQLAQLGFSVGDVIAEDFAWCVPLESESPRLYVACASAGEKTNHWRIFVFAEGGVLGRLFGKDKSADALISLFATVKQILQSAPSVENLHEDVA